MLARISSIEVTPDLLAKVIINERTGIIAADGNVPLLPVALSQGGITISVREPAHVAQPNALASGDTTVVADTNVESAESAPALTYVDGAISLADVAQALSVFGVSPRELASILPLYTQQARYAPK